MYVCMYVCSVGRFLPGFGCLPADQLLLATRFSLSGWNPNGIDLTTYMVLPRPFEEKSSTSEPVLLA